MSYFIYHIPSKVKRNHWSYYDIYDHLQVLPFYYMFKKNINISFVYSLKDNFQIPIQWHLQCTLFLSPRITINVLHLRVYSF